MSEWMIVVQLIGFIAMAFGVLSFQPKYRKNILRFQVVSNLFWVIHFSLIGAATGAAQNGTSALRAYLFNTYGSRKNRSIWLFVAVILLALGVTVLTWKNWLSLLPMAGICISTTGLWQRNEQRIRLISFFSSPLWLTYNLFSGSYAGVLTELLMMASIVIALWRYRRFSLRQPAVQKTP